MTRTAIGLGFAAALAFAVSIGAQSAPAGAQKYPSASQKTGNEITVTGCVAKGPSGNFILTNAKVESSGTSSTAGTTGSTSAATPSGSRSGSMASEATWDLEGGAGANLAEHVGHKVQVTGMRGSSSAMGRPGSTAGTTGSASPSTPPSTSSSSSAAHPQLNVTTVKMISTSCS